MIALDPRRKGILTGSQVGGAIGVSPYASRQETWRLITGRKIFEGNEATEYGSAMESSAVLAYEIKTDTIVQKSLDSQEFIMYEDWLGITPDGYVGDIYFEAKCPFSLRIPEEVPPHYMAQVQVGMKITKRLIAHLCYWTPKKLKVFEIKYNDEYWQAVLPLMLEFNQYLKDDVEPKRKGQPILPTKNAGVIIDERN